jgi:Putative transposase
MEARARTTVERLARNISRPAVSVERLARTAQGDVRYRLKTPCQRGATHILPAPLDFFNGDLAPAVSSYVLRRELHGLRAFEIRID